MVKLQSLMQNEVECFSHSWPQCLLWLNILVHPEHYFGVLYSQSHAVQCLSYCLPEQAPLSFLLPPPPFPIPLPFNGASNGEVKCRISPQFPCNRISGKEIRRQRCCTSLFWGCLFGGEDPWQSNFSYHFLPPCCCVSASKGLVLAFVTVTLLRIYSSQWTPLDCCGRTFEYFQRKGLSRPAFFQHWPFIKPLHNSGNFAISGFVVVVVKSDFWMLQEVDT